MVVWYWLGLQLPVQSVPITTTVVSSNPIHGEVYSIIVIQFVCDLRHVLRFPPPIKNHLHDITVILLKVALNTINLNQPMLNIYILNGNISIFIFCNCSLYNISWLYTHTHPTSVCTFYWGDTSLCMINSTDLNCTRDIKKSLV